LIHSFIELLVPAVKDSIISPRYSEQVYSASFSVMVCNVQLGAICLNVSVCVYVR